MDIVLIKTFLEVSATGSFVSASDRLLVTQSAVSLRIQRLEDALGRQLFTRSKAGAELTPAGKEFERYALGLVKLWEEARQQVGIPEGFTKSLSIGGQYSLWPRLGFRWIDALREAKPDLSLRAEVGMPDRITRFLSEGIVQAALLYSPQLRPGLTLDKVWDEELVMVASWPAPTLDLDGRYLFVDWGPEFVRAHASVLPDLTSTGFTFALGALALEFILRRPYAAYVPARTAKRYIDSGQLHLVADAPIFPYPVWVVWREDMDEDVAKIARYSLDLAAESVGQEKEEVLGRLQELSRNNELTVLGELAG